MCVCFRGLGSAWLEFAENYRSYTRMEMGDSCHYHDYVCCISAAPQYVLDPDYVEAAEGESPIIHFTVTSDPPLAEDAKHVVSKVGSVVPSDRVNVSSNSISFRGVKRSDEGEYVISSSNAVGKGQGRFSLKVRSKLQHSLVSNIGVL